MAAPGGLCGAARGYGVAGARRAQFQILPPIPDRKTRQAEARAQEARGEIRHRAQGSGHDRRRGTFNTSGGWGTAPAAPGRPSIERGTAYQSVAAVALKQFL